MENKKPRRSGVFLKTKTEELLTGFFFDVFDHIADGLELFGVLIGNFNREFFLEGHDEFNSIERVGSEVLNEGGCGRHLFGVHSELLDDDIFYFFFDGFFRHVIELDCGL